MSYMHSFHGVLFYTALPYRNVVDSFREFCVESRGRLGEEHKLVIRHENEGTNEDGNLDGAELAQIEIYLHHGLVDGKVTRGLMEWVQRLMSEKAPITTYNDKKEEFVTKSQKQVMRVYCSSSSDEVKDAPFFYVVTKRKIDWVSVEDLFSRWTSKDKRT